MLGSRGGRGGGNSIAEGILTMGTDTFSGTRQGEGREPTDIRGWTRNIIKIRPGEKGQQ